MYAMENGQIVSDFSCSGYSDYIMEQMAKARAAAVPEERFRAVANALAANTLAVNSLWTRTADIDRINVSGQTQPLNHAAIEKISAGICTDKAFQALMFYSVYIRPDAGNLVDRLTNHLRNKAASLQSQEPDQTALEALCAIQRKVKAGTETPEDYAKLIAVHYLSAQPECGPQCAASGGKTGPGCAIARKKSGTGCGGMAAEKCRDLNRRLDGGLIRRETERVMRDPDFQYLMKHESRKILRLNALRVYGLGFLGYAGRVRQLQAAERETAALSGRAVRGKTGQKRIMPDGRMKRAPPVCGAEASAAAVSGGIGKSGGSA